jgi:hypothetical protein
MCPQLLATSYREESQKHAFPKTKGTVLYSGEIDYVRPVERSPLVASLVFSSSSSPPSVAFCYDRTDSSFTLPKALEFDVAAFKPIKHRRRLQAILGYQTVLRFCYRWSDGSPYLMPELMYRARIVDIKNPVLLSSYQLDRCFAQVSLFWNRVFKLHENIDLDVAAFDEKYHDDDDHSVARTIETQSVTMEVPKYEEFSQANSRRVVIDNQREVTAAVKPKNVAVKLTKEQQLKKRMQPRVINSMASSSSSLVSDNGKREEVPEDRRDSLDGKEI